ncbi:MAG: hypothetical protein NWF03_08560 [Candidatus Bathyarchaeota archaeon]|nr:hypothetical protein [Candidatus Bathyarchaeota archaeon]
MNAGIAWGAIIGVLVFFTEESMRVMVGGISSIIFWVLVGVYFYWDYRITHKKPEPPLVAYASMPYKIAKPTKIKKSSNKKWIFLKNFFFIALGITEAVYFLSVPILFWETVTIPVDGLNIAVMTYQNGILLLLFAFGLYVSLIMVSRLRHPRKAFFDE